LTQVASKSKEDGKVTKINRIEKRMENHMHFTKAHDFKEGSSEDEGKRLPISIDTS
jgi:hypothetical protein